MVCVEAGVLLRLCVNVALLVWVIDCDGLGLVERDCVGVYAALCD